MTAAVVVVGWAVHLRQGRSPLAGLDPWVQRGLLAVLVVGALAAAGAPDPLLAVLGDPTRLGGLTTSVLLVGAFGLGAAVDRRRLRQVAAASTAGLAVVAVVALLQRVGAIGSSDRATGALGNPALLGAELCVTVPVAAALVLDPGSTLRTRRAAAATALLGVAALAATGTRGAWLGGLVGLAVLLAWRAGRRARSAIGALALAAAVAILLVPAGTRGSGIGTDAGTGRGRLDTWSESVSVIADRPLLGWGQEGFRRGFAQHASDGWVARYGLRELPDRAHNSVLDLLVSQGLLGLGAGCLLLAGVGRVLLRRIRAGEWVPLGVTAAALAWLVQGLFLFDVVDAGLALSVLVGAACGAAPGPEPAPRRARAWWLAPVAGAAVLGVAALGVVADHQVERADGRDLGRAIAGLRDAARTRPRSLEVELVAGSLAVRSADAQVLREAHDLLRRWDDPDVRLRDAEVLAALAEVERDRALAAQARDTYVEGLGEWPANGRGWLGYGRVLARLGDEASAERALHRAERLLPRDAAPKVELALLDLRRGDTAAACGHLSAALGRREAPSLEDLQRLLREAGRDPTCLRRTG